MNAALEALRAATRELHDAVERTPTMAMAAANPGDPLVHAGYLMALAVAIRPLALAVGTPSAARLTPYAPRPADWALLDEDLRECGAILPLPPPRPPPPATSPGAAWGRLYVVRGAEAGIALLDHRLDGTAEGRRRPRRLARRLMERRGEWPAICRALGALGPDELQEATGTAHGDFAYALEAIRRLETTAQRAVA